MNKADFLWELRKKISGLPDDDILRSLDYYGELIDDMVENGMSEEDAVAALGSLDDIVRQILTDTPLPKLIKEKVKPNRRLRAWEIILIILGFPVWFPLAVAAFAVIISLYASFWAIVISLWAAFGAFVGSAFGSFVGGIVLVCTASAFSGISLISAALVCAGLAIFMFFGCLEATKGAAKLAKIIVLGIKKCFINREAAK